MGKEKKIPNYWIFTILSIAFLIGIAVGSVLNLKWQNSWPVLTITSALLMLSALYNHFLKNKYLILVAWSLAIMVIGLSWYVYYDKKSDIKITYGEKVEFSGTIIKQPDKDYKQQKIIIRTNDFNQKTNILVNAPRYPDLAYGNKVKVAGKIEKPGVIEDFDYGSYLKRISIYSVVYQPDLVENLGTEKTTASLILRELYAIPGIFEGSTNTVLTEPQASLAGGLLFGSKRSIPDSLKNDLSNTGLTHIIALSGYNVTIIITVLSMILAKYFGNKKAFWLGTVFVIFFVLITGSAPSVLRAAVFSILIIYGKLLGRRGNQTNLMLLAAVSILLFNPYLLIYDIGFQLSFGAFAGLIYLSPIIEALFNRSSLKYLPVYLKAPLTETLSAQIMVMPLLILYFGKLSFIAPIANVLVLWTIPLAMIMALSTSIAALIWWPLGKLISFLAWPALSYIIAISNLLAKVPFASIEIKNFNFAIAFTLYLVLIMLILVIKKRLKKFKAQPVLKSL